MMTLHTSIVVYNLVNYISMKIISPIWSILLLLSVAIGSCKQEKNLCTLEANLTNISDGTLFKLKRLRTADILDSAYVINGHLSLKARIPSRHPEKLFLSATDAVNKEFIYTFLLVENEQLTFNADKKSFPWNIDVSGSIHNDKAEAFNQIQYHRQEMVKKLKHIHGSEEALLVQKLTEVSDSLDAVTVKLMKETFNSYAALEEFKYHKKKFSTEELRELYASLDVDLRETVSGKAIKLQSQYPMPQEGDHYYDYRALNQKGDTMALSDIKGKYTLLHFSSSACYGSQLSLPELKDLYKRHANDL